MDRAEHGLESFEAGPLTVLAPSAQPRQKLAIVLCHGYAMAGNHLALAPRRSGIGGNARWYFPQGAISLPDEPGKRAWYDRPSVATVDETVPHGLKAAASDLASCIGALVRDHDLDIGRTFVGGFSQGAVVAIQAALDFDGLFAGLVVLAGRLVAAHRARPRRAWEGLAVFQSHAHNDDAIPFASAVALRDVLEGHGARVTFHEHDGGHAMTKEVAVALGAFLDPWSGFCRTPDSSVGTGRRP